MKLSMNSSISQTTDNTAEAAKWLKRGGLLAYPTESVWGVGCDPFNELAVAQLLAIKQRPMDKGMILVTDSVSRIMPLLASLNAKQRQMVIDSWKVSSNEVQQAQTWLLPLSEPLEIAIPSWVTGAHSSIAVRVIAHPLIQQLCAQMVTPENPYGFIVSTSCNPSGQPPALSLEQAQAYFGDENFAKNVGYLAGETLGYKMPSQISDALTGKVVR